MDMYDNNRQSITIPGNSVLHSINSNCGTITVGPNCKILECNENRGHIQFQHGLCIGNINNNRGHISITNGSKVDSIVNNRGCIILASDCVLMNTQNNYGSIIGGKPNFKSVPFSVTANSSPEYNGRNIYRNIFDPSNITGLNSARETLRPLFDRLKLGSVGNGLLTSLDLDLKLKSTFKEKVPIPSAPLLNADKNGNCSTPTAPLSADADQTLCVICMERPKNVAFQCGHLCCANCSEKLQVCHMCRVKINQKINLFL